MKRDACGRPFFVEKICRPTKLAPLPKGGWHGGAVTGGFVFLTARQGTRALPYKKSRTHAGRTGASAPTHFPARTHSKGITFYPARNPSTRARLVPLPLGKGGNGFTGVRCKPGRADRGVRPYKQFRRGRCPHRPAPGTPCGASVGRGALTPPPGNHCTIAAAWGHAALRKIGHFFRRGDPCGRPPLR